MTIECIKMHQGELTAICDNGEGVTLDKLDGQVMVGATVTENGDRWLATAGNLDVDCPGGVCPVK